jgi:transcriptional regulator with XRE-family HTH domain
VDDASAIANSPVSSLEGVAGERSIISGALKSARRRSGKSLREMARLLGCSSAYVAKVERGGPINERMIMRYAEALHLDVEIRLVPREEDNGERQEA